MTDFAVQLGANLRALREERRWSLNDVAQHTNREFRVGILGAYERGERALHTERLHRLLDVYQATIDQVWPDTGQVPPTLAAGATVARTVTLLDSTARTISDAARRLDARTHPTRPVTKEGP